MADVPATSTPKGVPPPTAPAAFPPASNNISTKVASEKKAVSKKDSRGLSPVAVAARLRRSAAMPEAPWLHGEVARRMAERLPFIKLQPATVVDWWGHLGNSGAVLEAAYPKAKRIVVEPCDALVERSRRAADKPWWQKLRGASVTVVRESEVPAGAAQMLWANMMLQAADDPPRVMDDWHRAVAVDGFVMFSCLGPDTLRQLRSIYRQAEWGPPGADFVDMHDFGDMMVAAGFADPVMDQEQITLTWDSPTALLLELRSLGGNVSPNRFAGLRTPRWRARLESALAAMAGGDGRIEMTFEVAYGHAFKAAPRHKLEGETRVPLDDMRAMVRAGRSR
jgi:malonyl-CoA O-methyltransferase